MKLYVWSTGGRGWNQSIYALAESEEQALELAKSKMGSSTFLVDSLLTPQNLEVFEKPVALVEICED